jgi:peroxiredoxin
MSRLSVAEFLPDIQLPSAPDGQSVSLRESSGKTSVIFSVHGAACPGCREYIDQLARIAAEFVIWDAQLLVVAPSSREEVARINARGTVLADEGRRLADGASASLIVADRYGHIFYAIHSEASHDLPAPRDVEEWLKYLGTLCPE